MLERTAFVYSNFSCVSYPLCFGGEKRPEIVKMPALPPLCKIVEMPAASPLSTHRQMEYLPST
jgi:hypothetical protein